MHCIRPISILVTAVLLSPVQAGPVPASLEPNVRARIHAAVARVVALGEHGRATGQGSGFVVSTDGFMLTNHHVVTPAISAVAMFADGGDPVPLELWAVRADLDLALLRLVGDGAAPRANDPPAAAVHLEMTPTEPEPRTPVFAAGFPAGAGFTITTGTAIAVHGPDDVQLTRGGRRLAMSGRWIETDVTIGPGSSGGPLLDAAGRVVGVNTWRVEHEREVNLSLAAPEALVFFLTARNEAGLGFVGSALPRVKAVETSGPLPTTLIEPRWTGGQAQSAIAAMRSSFTCRACRGGGTVGGRGPQGGAVRKPCPRCGGAGVAPEPSAWHAVTRAAERVAGLAEEDERWLGRLGSALSKVFKAPAWRSAARSRIVPEAKRVLGAGDAAAGEVVVVPGRVVVSRGGRVFVMVDASLVVCVSRPRVVQAAGGLAPGDEVVAGGIVAGVAGPPGGAMVVLDGGFVVE